MWWAIVADVSSFSDGLSWAAIGVLVVVVGSIATPLIGIYAILFSQNGKVGQILGRLGGIEETIQRMQTELQNESSANLSEHERINQRLDDHERRIRTVESCDRDRKQHDNQRH